MYRFFANLNTLQSLLSLFLIHLFSLQINKQIRCFVYSVTEMDCPCNSATHRVAPDNETYGASVVRQFLCYKRDVANRARKTDANACDLLIARERSHQRFESLTNKFAQVIYDWVGCKRLSWLEWVCESSYIYAVQRQMPAANNQTYSHWRYARNCKYKLHLCVFRHWPNENCDETFYVGCPTASYECHNVHLSRRGGG